MTTDQILETAGIPLLLFVILIYYGMRLWFMKDISAIRGKNKPPVKRRRKLCKIRRKADVLFAVATLVMMLLLFWNTYVAVAEIIICTVILGILWHNMNAKYGD